jgi:hypothetical protein
MYVISDDMCLVTHTVWSMLDLQYFSFLVKFLIERLSYKLTVPVCVAVKKNG